MAYEFHYTPTGTGAISGAEVLEQTEDAINDLGNTAISGVREALDKAELALTNSANAVDDAQTALNTANNAEGVAIQAQNDVSNLSGTVTNIGNRVTTAEGNIGNLQGRMTTAEGNIGNLQDRMTTAEGNIGNLQTAVSTAQAIANSAQQTATTARQQSYVFRYSSTALTPSSTNSNALLDNTDNLKVGDKVIDSSGVLFSVTAIDTQNSTFTIGTALIDLAQDSDVVHKSGDEDVIGSKRFGVVQNFTGYPSIRLYSTGDDINELPSYVQQRDIRFTDKNNAIIAYFIFQHRNNADEPFRTCWRQVRLDGTDGYYSVNFNNLGEFYPENNNAIVLGRSSNKWKDVQTYKVNNLEPSSLSLPSGNVSDVIDISSYLTYLDGTDNTYVAPSNGWITINMNNCTGIHATIAGFWSDSRVRTSAGAVKFLMPVLKNQTVTLTIHGGTINNARFIPCQGNV